MGRSAQIQGKWRSWRRGSSLRYLPNLNIVSPEDAGTTKKSRPEGRPPFSNANHRLSVANAALDFCPPPERIEPVGGIFNSPVDANRSLGVIETPRTVSQVNDERRQAVRILIGTPDLIPIRGNQGQNPVSERQPGTRRGWAMGEAGRYQTQMREIPRGYRNRHRPRKTNGLFVKKQLRKTFQGTLQRTMGTLFLSQRYLRCEKKQYRSKQPRVRKFVSWLSP